MLILTRFVGQRIMIGNDTIVTLLDVGYGKVKIGIEAPKDVRIDREEVRDRINKEGMK